MYGSSGEMTTELAVGLAGGKEYTDQTDGLSSVAARVALTEATDTIQPFLSVLDMAQVILEHGIKGYCPFGMVKV